MDKLTQLPDAGITPEGPSLLDGPFRGHPDVPGLTGRGA